MVKSVSSSEIEKNFGFSTEITVLPFSQGMKFFFLGFYILPLLKEFRSEIPHTFSSNHMDMQCTQPHACKLVI